VRQKIIILVENFNVLALFATPWNLQLGANEPLTNLPPLLPDTSLLSKKLV